MDMVTPPLVIDLPTEVAAEVDERDRGLLGEDEAVGWDVSHDQETAVIMVAHSIFLVYAVCNVQVLGKLLKLRLELSPRLPGRRQGHHFSLMSANDLLWGPWRVRFGRLRFLEFGGWHSRRFCGQPASGLGNRFHHPTPAYCTSLRLTLAKVYAKFGLWLEWAGMSWSEVALSTK
jgi:hypothetical protein